MPERLNLDYIAYLQDKWKSYLLKGDPYNIKQLNRYSEVLDMIDEMKDETLVGRMLYYYFNKLHSQAKEEQKAYQLYLRNQR